MRLNKFISESGMCSRREADGWIERGRVTVNGTRATLGTQVAAGDDVRVDGAPVRTRSQTVYLMLNKPVGIECTTDTRVRDNIVDFVGHTERIFPIGRLDKASEGLILLTNNGDIVNEILRSENNHEKEYLVTVDRPITAAFLSQMSAGVPILGTMTKRCRVEATGKSAFRIVLTQGLNRQIRRMCTALGYEVRTLRRVRIMNLRLAKLAVGHWRNLTSSELRELLPTVQPAQDPPSGAGPGARRSPAQRAPGAHRPAKPGRSASRNEPRAKPREKPRDKPNAPKTRGSGRRRR